MQRRQLGKSHLHVSPVASGCWPITGITSLDVNEADSLDTLRACLDCGINFLDTAYCYGARGESEQLIAQALGSHRNQMVIATKAGVHWDSEGRQRQDARPDTLRRECEESPRRLRTDRVELLYLHRADPEVPVAESAGALQELMDHGKALTVGASNLTLAQLEEFQSICPLSPINPAIACFTDRPSGMPCPGAGSMRSRSWSTGH